MMTGDVCNFSLPSVSDGVTRNHVCKVQVVTHLAAGPFIVCRRMDNGMAIVAIAEDLKVTKETKDS